VIKGHNVALSGFRLAGLGDRCAGTDDPAFFDALAANAPRLAPAHNPDSAERLRPMPHLLALAGHSHGGQMRILFPWARPAGALWASTLANKGLN
jgi:predicted MPP superfamily phosphohydrolase